MSIFDRKVGEVQDRKYAPPGWYVVAGTQYKAGESPEKKTPFVEIDFRLLEAQGDQDMTGVDLAQSKINRRFFITEKSEAILDEFIQKVLGKEAVGLSTGEALDQAMGQPVLALVELTTNSKTGKQYREITRFKKAA